MIFSMTAKHATKAREIAATRRTILQSGIAKKIRVRFPAVSTAATTTMTGSWMCSIPGAGVMTLPVSLVLPDREVDSLDHCLRKVVGGLSGPFLPKNICLAKMMRRAPRRWLTLDNFAPWNARKVKSVPMDLFVPKAAFARRPAATGSSILG